MLKCPQIKRVRKSPIIDRIASNNIVQCDYLDLSLAQLDDQLDLDLELARSFLVDQESSKIPARATRLALNESTSVTN